VAFATGNLLRLPEVRSTDLACRCFDCSESAPESEIGVFFSFFSFLPSSVLVCFDCSRGVAVLEFVVRFFLISFVLLDLNLVCPDAASGFPEAILGLLRCFLETRIDSLPFSFFSSLSLLRPPGRGNVDGVEEGCDLVFGGTIFPCSA
jgi:hypothetical protein